MAFSPDSTTLASGSYDGEIKLWDVASQTRIASFKEEGFYAKISSLAFSPDGTTLASGGGGNEPGNVRLWDVATKRKIATFPHKFSVTSVAFSPDGKIIASASIGIVRLWHIATLSEIATFPHTDDVWSVAFSPDGKIIASGTSNGGVNLWSSVDITSLLPSDKVVSIPDAKLAEAIREKIGNLITTHTLLRLTELEAQQREITNLTGLEHAHNLKILGLGNNSISDITPLAKLTKLTTLWLGGTGNPIPDITPLAKLTKLTNLSLSYNTTLSDISPLANLTSLRFLSLRSTTISDITPLAKLTKLTNLDLSDIKISDISLLSEFTKLVDLHLNRNRISDVRPLTNLVNLRELRLVGNPIKNRKPLLALLRKNPDIKIYLKNHREPLPVTLSHFRADHTEAGVVLNWTTESEVDNAGFNIYRSRAAAGNFKKVNGQLITGAGTTGERTEYTWTDMTAKPHTVYYYRIEDVSHAGEHKQLVTVRLRGLVSAKHKMKTRWADMKK